MTEKMKVDAKVIGKWIKKGWISEKAMLSIEFLDAWEPRYYDLPVKRALWYAVEIGSEITVTMEKHEFDGLWRPV